MVPEPQHEKSLSSFIDLAAACQLVVPLLEETSPPIIQSTSSQIHAVTRLVLECKDQTGESLGYVHMYVGTRESPLKSTTDKGLAAAALTEQNSIFSRFIHTISNN